MKNYQADIKKPGIAHFGGRKAERIPSQLQASIKEDDV